MTYISVKLPPHVTTVFLPNISGTAATVYSNDVRVTEDGETRLTEDGETRVLDAFDITCYPELENVKIHNSVMNVSVPV